MFIMILNYDNGQIYEEACQIVGQIVSERGKIMTFETAETAREYALIKFNEDSRDNRNDDYTILIDKDNTLAYQSVYGDSTMYRWVNLNDLNNVIKQ